MFRSRPWISSIAMAVGAMFLPSQAIIQQQDPELKALERACQSSMKDVRAYSSDPSNGISYSELLRGFMQQIEGMDPDEKKACERGIANENLERTLYAIEIGDTESLAALNDELENITNATNSNPDVILATNAKRSLARMTLVCQEANAAYGIGNEERGDALRDFYLNSGIVPNARFADIPKCSPLGPAIKIPEFPIGDLPPYDRTEEPEHETLRDLMRQRFHDPTINSGNACRNELYSVIWSQISEDDQGVKHFSQRIESIPGQIRKFARDKFRGQNIGEPEVFACLQGVIGAAVTPAIYKSSVYYRGQPDNGVQQIMDVLNASADVIDIVGLADTSLAEAAMNSIPELESVRQALCSRRQELLNIGNMVSRRNLNAITHFSAYGYKMRQCGPGQQ